MLGLFKKKCGICKRKTSLLRTYRRDRGHVIKVCPACGEYAERRAYKKA
ncbi:hypothetical protein C772_02027 [Bhargavaea cecembensis DSE10]|uniref:Uncharacterized protein n=1 Tax=Bhargavaea cecembensis DSE10 TaxID=1235279 RepID=M7NFL4_9BACL|nr:hypothetical protein [Bhargavaea cecembensis]EMR06047.1 hypothetical protein C772_02027 [Bhargavaea cecembensis DSE10]